MEALREELAEARAAATPRPPSACSAATPSASGGTFTGGTPAGGCFMSTPSVVGAGGSNGAAPKPAAATVVPVTAKAPADVLASRAAPANIMPPASLLHVSHDSLGDDVSSLFK